MTQPTGLSGCARGRKLSSAGPVSWADHAPGYDVSTHQIVPWRSRISPGYLFDIPDPSEAFSTPLDVPLLGRPPARFLDCEILTIQYRSDPDAIRAIVPRPLTPTGDTVMVQFGRWGDVPGMGQPLNAT